MWSTMCNEAVTLSQRLQPTLHFCFVSLMILIDDRRSQYINALRVEQTGIQHRDEFNEKGERSPACTAPRHGLE